MGRRIIQQQVVACTCDILAGPDCEVSSRENHPEGWMEIVVTDERLGSSERYDACATCFRTALGPLSERRAT